MRVHAAMSSINAQRIDSDGPMAYVVDDEEITAPVSIMSAWNMHCAVRRFCLCNIFLADPWLDTIGLWSSMCWLRLQLFKCYCFNVIAVSSLGRNSWMFII